MLCETQMKNAVIQSVAALDQKYFKNLIKWIYPKIRRIVRLAPWIIQMSRDDQLDLYIDCSIRKMFYSSKYGLNIGENPYFIGAKKANKHLRIPTRFLYVKSLYFPL